MANPGGRGHIQGRSQSLLEIGTTGFDPQTSARGHKKEPPSPRGRTRSSVQLNPSQAAPSTSADRAPTLLEQRRRSALSKLKGLVIPENNESLGSSSSSVESPKNVVLSTPPWKSSNSTLPKYSPAFKRKPFTVYSNTTATSSPGVKPTPESVGPKPRPAERRFHEISQQDDPPKIPKRLSVTSTSSHIKSDNDSDNDSAVSSGRSSLSHGSASPPPSSAPPQPAERKSSAQLVKKSEAVDDDGKSENPRILKKDSVEAINRRNIIESCRTSSGINSLPLTAPAPTPTPTPTTLPGKPKKFPVSDDHKSGHHDEKIFRSCPPPPGRPASR